MQKVWRPLLTAAFFAAGAAGSVAALGFVYRCLFASWIGRTDALVAFIAGGMAGTLCLAGLTELLDRPMDWQPRPRFFIRWPLDWAKRLALLFQIVTMGVVVAAAIVLLFGFDIPRVAALLR